MRTAELRTRATATSFSCNVDRRENRPEGVSGSVVRDLLVNGSGLTSSGQRERLIAPRARKETRSI